jgi:hypothetical protein
MSMAKAYLCNNDWPIRQLGVTAKYHHAMANGYGVMAINGQLIWPAGQWPMA